MKRFKICSPLPLYGVLCAFVVGFVHCGQPQPPSGKDTKNVGKTTYPDSVLTQKKKEKNAVPARLDSLKVGNMTNQSATE